MLSLSKHGGQWPLRASLRQAQTDIPSLTVRYSILSFRLSGKEGCQAER